MVSRWRSAGGFEDAAQFDEARGHHGEVSHHVVAAEKGVEGLYHVGDFAGLFGDRVVGFPGLDVPMPGVFKGVNLTGSGGAVLFLKEGVVALRGVEGRIEIDEVHRLVLQITPKDVEIVAVVKRAHVGSLENRCPPAKQKGGRPLRAARHEGRLYYWPVPLAAASACCIFFAISALTASRLKLAPRCIGG